VATGEGIVKLYAERAAKGTMSKEDAQKAAKDALRAMRFGQNGYLFIVDSKPQVILNPGLPQTEGNHGRRVQGSRRRVRVPRDPRRRAPHHGRGRRLFHLSRPPARHREPAAQADLRALRGRLGLVRLPPACS
jgi:hypothetical protein